MSSTKEIADLCGLGQFVCALYNELKDKAVACEKAINELRSAVWELQDKRETTDQRIRGELGQTSKVIPRVQNWLTRAIALEKDAHRLIAKYDGSSGGLCAYTPHVCKTIVLSNVASVKLDEVKSWTKEAGEFPEVVIDLFPNLNRERHEGIVVGMDSELKDIQSCVREENNASVIAIYGMGRVGKSTILGKSSNKFVTEDNEIQIWIDLAKHPGVDMIQKEIIHKVTTLEWKDNPSETADHIFKELKYGPKSYLLILDNVWEPLDLREVGIPYLQNSKKVKVILSTRLMEVCTRMNAKKIIKVKCLSLQDSWDLFIMKAGEAAQGRMTTDSRMQEQALELVSKCNGLPEALIYLGYDMASKESLGEWQYVNEELMDTRPWKIQNMHEVLSSLKQSYVKLDDNLKKCLLYCSLYPAGFSIYQQWIVDYCIGEGLFSDYGEGAVGIGKLKAASMLEKGDNEYEIRMHRMIRAMALWIACEYGEKENRWLVQPKLDLKKAPGNHQWAAAQRISLMRNEIDTLPECPNCPELETLMLQRNRPLKKIPDDFFKSMSVLKVLDLSHTDIEELPVGIGGLVSLQYLDVCGTKIRSLPKELGRLGKLMFLLLSDTPIKTIPDGVIAKLSKLRVFYVDFSYRNWKVASVGTGVGFEEFEALTQLKTLGISIEHTEALQELVRSPSLGRCTRNLEIRGCKNLKAISNESFGGDSLRNVQMLRIGRANELKEVTIDDGEWYLQNVRDLTLLWLPDVKIVWNRGCFKGLSKLVIYRCDGMESLVHWNNDEVSEEEGERMGPIDAFPLLVKLSLIQLPELKSLCNRGRKLAFPKMQSFQVIQCPKLNKLAMVADKLQVISGGELWEKAGTGWRAATSTSSSSF